MSALGITCPECSRALKLSGPVPAGKMVKCPGCGTLFAAPARKPRVAVAEEDEPEVRVKRHRRQPAVIKVSRVDEEEQEYDKPWWVPQGLGLWPFLIGSGILATVLLAGGTTALIAWLRSDPPAKPPDPVTAAAQAPTHQQPLNWIEFVPPDEAYVVYFPGRPTHRSAAAASERDLYLIELDNKQTVFAVGYFGPLVPKLTQEELFAHFRRLVKAAPELGKVVSEKPISLDGIAAMEFELAPPATGYAVLRMCLVKGRPFILLYEGRRFNASSPEVKYFFDSFQMTGN